MAEYFSLNTPSDWVQLELRPRYRDSAIRDLVADRIREVPELHEHRATVVQVMRRFAREAWESGARFASAFAVPAGGSLLTGCITVSEIPDPPGVGADRVAGIAEHLTATAAEPGEETYTSVALVEIEGVGTCPRAFGVEDVREPGGDRVLRSVTMQTFVPTPGGTLLLVSAASPATDLADDLLDLFDAVTGTLRVGQLPDDDDHQGNNVADATEPA